MPFQELLVNTFSAIKSVIITPPSSPPSSLLDNPTAKAVRVPSPDGYFTYDAEKAFQIPNNNNQYGPSGIWVPIKRH
jgi:hypothetical protein